MSAFGAGAFAAGFFSIATSATFSVVSAACSSFTGYLLPWDQLAIWAVTVGGNMAGYTPVIGAQAKFGLFAGLEATTATLLRFYVLHVLFLPFIIVIFMAVHFWRVRKDGGISGPL